MAFKVCDLDGNSSIERDEVLQIATQLSQILQQLESSDEQGGYEYCDNPEEVVNNLFNRGQTISKAKAKKAHNNLFHDAPPLFFLILARFKIDHKNKSFFFKSILLV